MEETIKDFTKRIRDKQQLQKESGANLNDKMMEPVEAIKKAIDKFTDDSSHYNVHCMELRIEKLHPHKDEFKVFPMDDADDVIYTGPMCTITDAWDYLSREGLASSASLGYNGHMLFRW